MAYLDDVTNILEIRPNGLPTVVRLSQNENGRKLYFRLTGNETAIPSGVTVTISGTKPDGVVYSASGTITNDVVLINENTQMTAVAGTWDAKIKIVSSGQTIATGRVRFEIDADTVAPGSVPSDSELEGLVAEAQAYAENARSAAYGSPLTASTVAGMTDQTRVYVYTGSETGYTAGNWYYWNGTAWTSGGVYNSTALQTDTTLAIPGMAADAKATGDAIDGLDARLDTAEDDITDVKSDFNDIKSHIEIGTGYVKSVDGFDANNSVSLGKANSPYVLSDDNFDYSNGVIKKIEIKIFDTGTLTIGTIKKNKVVEGASFNRADVTVKAVLTFASSGSQVIELQDGIEVEQDESVTVMMPSDTASFMYGAGTDRGFMLANQSTGKWQHDGAFSLGITLYVEETEYIDAVLVDLSNNITDLSEQLEDKIDKDQGIENAGRILAIMPDGTVAPRGTFTARVITAFANLLQHVVYTDEYYEAYYDELIDSLRDDGSDVPVDLTVIYNSIGHTVYRNMPLDSLKSYLTVTAIYSDTSQQPVLDYVLSGELSSATSIITVSYMGLSEQIEVAVDLSVEYVLPSPIDVSVDTSNAITLNYIPRIGTSFSMIVKSIANAKNNDDARILMNNYEEVTPNSGNFVGLQILIMTINGVRQLKVMFGGNENLYYNFNDSTTKNMNFAMAYDATNGNFTALVYENGVQKINGTVGVSNSFVNQRQLYVGGGDVGWVPYKGIINDLIIYNRVLTSEEMISMIGGE